MHVTRDPPVMERVDDPAPNQNPTVPEQVSYQAPNLTPTVPEGGHALATEQTSFNGQEKFETAALNPGQSNVQTCCNQSPRSDCMTGVTSCAGWCNSSVFPATASTASSSSPSNGLNVLAYPLFYIMQQNPDSDVMSSDTGSAVTFTTSEFLGPYYLQTINPEVLTPVSWGHIVAFDPYLQTINPEVLTPVSWGHIVAFDPEVLPSLSGDHIIALNTSVGPPPSSVGLHHQLASHQIGSRLNSEPATPTWPRSSSIEPTPLLGLAASSHGLMSSSIGPSASLFRPATSTGTRSSPIGPTPLLRPAESLSGVTSSSFGPRASLFMPLANTSRPRPSSVEPTSQLGVTASSSKHTSSLSGPRASLFRRVTTPTGPRTSCVGPTSLLGHTTSSSGVTSSTSLSSGKADFGVSPAQFGLEPYCITPEGDIVSISAMPVYNNMSHEELRWLYYTQGHGNGLASGNHSQQQNNCLSSMTETSLGGMNHSIGARTGTIDPVICHEADAASGTYIEGQSGSITPNHISINIQIPVQLASQLLDSMNSLCRNFSSTYPVLSHVNAPTGPASNSLPMGFGTTSVGFRTSSSFANAPQSSGLFYSSTPAFGQTVTSSSQSRFHQQTGLGSGAFGGSKPPTYP